MGAKGGRADRNGLGGRWVWPEDDLLWAMLKRSLDHQKLSETMWESVNKETLWFRTRTINIGGELASNTELEVKMDDPNQARPFSKRDPPPMPMCPLRCPA